MTTYFDRRRSVVIVDGVADGPTQSTRARLLLDTGAAITMVRPMTLAAAGYDSSKPVSTIRVATMSGIVEAPLFFVQRLTAVGQTWERVAVLGYELPRGLPFTGLLGANLLRGRRLTVDYRAGTIDLD
jgi:predicted aspartyl protease